MRFVTETSLIRDGREFQANHDGAQLVGIPSAYQGNPKAIMIKKALCTLILTSAIFASARASLLLSDDYSTFTNGDLVGQGGWLQTGAGTPSNPIQILSGAVVLAAQTGTDAYKPLSAIATLSAGDIITSTLTLTVVTATSGGDYFFHLSDPAGTTTNFYNRLYVKSSGSGFVLGIMGTSFSGSTPTYGTTELSLNTPLTITTIWTVVAGSANDTISISVGGTGYLAAVSFPAGSAEPATLSAANFRKGGGSTAAGVNVTSLSVDYTAAPVPEPGTVALVGLGLGVILFGARRRLA